MLNIDNQSIGEGKLGHQNKVMNNENPENKHFAVTNLVFLFAFDKFEP